MPPHAERTVVEERDDTVVPVANEKNDTHHLEFSPKDELVNVDYSGAHAKTDPAEIKLVKKLDLFIMPTLWIMYAFNYLDRNAIALARLDDLEDELKLEGTQYQTCVMVLFAGYLVGQVPSSKTSLLIIGYLRTDFVQTCSSRVSDPPGIWPDAWLFGQWSVL